MVRGAFGGACGSRRLWGEQYKKWSYDSLPILPQPWQYTVFKDRQKQFKILKDLMRRSDVSEVVNACDAGREGELIFRLVYHTAGCDKPFFPPLISLYGEKRNQKRALRS